MKPSKCEDGKRLGKCLKTRCRSTVRARRQQRRARGCADDVGQKRGGYFGAARCAQKALCRSELDSDVTTHCATEIHLQRSSTPWSEEERGFLDEVYANLKALASSCAPHHGEQLPLRHPSDGNALPAAAPPPAQQAAAPPLVAAPAALHTKAPGRFFDNTARHGTGAHASGSDRPRNAVRALFRPGERVRLQAPLASPPSWFIGQQMPPGVTFFAEAVVLDADEELARSDPDAARASAITMVFSVTRPWQSMSFCIGLSPDGLSSLLSYSMPIAFYRLQDGSLWCQHIDFYDAEDIRQMAARAGVGHSHLTSSMLENELLAGAGFKHTPLEEAEFYVHIFTLEGYKILSRTNRLPADAYFCRRVFNPATMVMMGTWLPPDAFTFGPWNT